MLAINANKVGLKINIAKTTVMRIGAQSNTALSITQSGIEMTIEDLEKFAYLGSVITKDGGADDDDVNAFHRLNKVWSARNISRRTKLRVFSAVWFGNMVSHRHHKRRLQIFINKSLRKLCGIFWPNVISNENLLVLTNSNLMQSEVKPSK